jgi:hypothetical protein
MRSELIKRLYNNCILIHILNKQIDIRNMYSIVMIYPTLYCIVNVDALPYFS